jgi:Rod binding domain-containing protein
VIALTTLPPSTAALLPLVPVRAPGSLHKQPATSPEGNKLRQAAGEFEAMLLANLWKSMKSTFSSDDDSDDPAHETLSDMGMQAISGAVGKAGGLGLSKLILKHLEPLLPQPQNGKAVSSPGKASAPSADTFFGRQ